MGAYLSSPNCDKDTHEGANTRLAFAASSMQGWRMSQEDAHNAMLNFDENTSLFAVYDGHGGSEIAVYCSQYLPTFIKKLKSYEEGKLNEALVESFIKFDAVLLEPDVKKILKRLANDDNEENEPAHEFVQPLNSNEENHHNDELNVEEAHLLKKDAEVPIEELIKRYNGEEKHFHSPNLTKRILNNEEKIKNVEVNEESQTLILKSDEEPEASSSVTRRQRKPVTTDAPTDIQSDSLTRHLISDSTDELDDDDDDSEFEESDEETSGDEAEDDENEEDKPLEGDKTAQIQKLMRKSIMAILNRRAKKKKTTENDQDDTKENQNEENGSNDEDEEGEDDGEEDEDELDDDEEETDLGMLDMENDPGSSSGCTAVVTLVRDKQLYVANAGDSRCVVCRAGKAVEMSVDHKPEDPEERRRIEKAGYKVTSDGRVSGGLNLSRAIGDHAYKKKTVLPAEEQAITSLPDIRTLTLDDQDEFMVIACDGIWNSMTSQEVMDFVRLRLDKKSLSQICEELFMYCLAPNTIGDGTGCDNMTAIIVKFKSLSQNLNNKRSLSPEPNTNSDNKKLKILTENGTTEQTSS